MGGLNRNKIKKKEKSCEMLWIGIIKSNEGNIESRIKLGIAKKKKAAQFHCYWED